MQKQFPGGVLPEEGVLWMCWGFSRVCLCVGVILIKWQSGFVEIPLLHCCSPVGLLHACGASFLENTSGGMLLSEDNFIHGSKNVFLKLFFCLSNTSLSSFQLYNESQAYFKNFVLHLQLLLLQEKKSLHWNRRSFLYSCFFIY